VARLDSPIADVLPERLERKKIAVIAVRQGRQFRQSA
jgi:hypothetical protein